MKHPNMSGFTASPYRPVLDNNGKFAPWLRALRSWRWYGCYIIRPAVKIIDDDERPLTLYVGEWHTEWRGNDTTTRHYQANARVGYDPREVIMRVYLTATLSPREVEVKQYELIQYWHPRDNQIYGTSVTEGESEETPF